jgi:hypothetical protein
MEVHRYPALAQRGVVSRRFAGQALRVIRLIVYFGGVRNRTRPGRAFHPYNCPKQAPQHLGDEPLIARLSLSMAAFCPFIRRERSYFMVNWSLY